MGNFCFARHQLRQLLRGKTAFRLLGLLNRADLGCPRTEKRNDAPLAQELDNSIKRYFPNLIIISRRHNRSLGLAKVSGKRLNQELGRGRDENR